MPGGEERAVLARQYKGTIVSLDPAFIGKDYLQRSQNWHPADFSFLLSKRRGTAAYVTAPSASRVDRMLRARSDTGDRYLLAAKWDPSGPQDEVFFVKNDAGVFTALAAGTGLFPSYQKRYGLVQHGNVVYAGNGVDPLKEIPLVDPLTAVDLSALGIPPGNPFNDFGQSATVVADATSTLVSGTYSYRWLVYDTVAKRWVSIGPVHTVSTTGARQRIDFLAPGFVPSPGLIYRLFVAPANQEIEGAHDQTPMGVDPGATFALLNEPTITGVPVPIPSDVTRTGSILVSHLGRLFIAGDVAHPRLLAATDVLRPGLEQAIFDNGTFFPANAYALFPDTITAAAVAALTTTQDSPSSPLAVFTETRTFLLLGDILDDPNAELVELSDHQGCIAQGAHAQTPMGLVHTGHESVYLLNPSIGMPVDIGWPIWPVIRAIPRASRPFVEMTYHKGFVKLAIPLPGQTTLTQQWWLDVRKPFDPTSDVPPWWGPMVGLTVSCFAQSEHEPLEDDRGWAALPASGGAVPIVLLDQPQTYRDDGTAIASVARTARIDDGQPFGRKLFTRTRAVARVASTTMVHVDVAVDGMRKTSGEMKLDGSQGALFNHLVPQGKGQFNHLVPQGKGKFGSLVDVEGEFIAPADRPRGRAIDLTFTHADPTAMVLRDIELRYQPVDRLVGAAPRSP